MEELKQHGRQPHPRSTANPISALTFWWTLDFFKIGLKREIEEDDLYEPLQEHKSDYLGDKFERLWRKEVKKAHTRNSMPKLLNVIVKCFGLKILFYGVIQMSAELIVRVAQPLFLGRLLRYFMHDGEVELHAAYMYAAGMVACSVVSSLILYPLSHAMFHMGMKIRVACCSLLYRKAMKMSQAALGGAVAGQVVNLLANDMNRFDPSVLFVHYLWIGPLEMVVVAYFMWTRVGVAALAGVSCLLVFIPFQGLLGKRMSYLRMKTALRSDKRVRLMNEIISGIQVIKLYTWENYFAKLIEACRRLETASIRSTAYVRCTMSSFGIFVTRFSIFISIVTYVLLGEAITAEKVFVVIAYYNLLADTMGDCFPKAIIFGAEFLVSTKRVQRFLMNDEIKKLPDYMEEHNVDSITQYSDDDDAGIDLMEASAKWSINNTENTLNNVNLTVTPKQLVAVIGPVGSGKSSLLQAILNELPLCSGSLCVKGKLSYASQQPWLFAASLRQNILFGEPFDRRRYRKVVKACALEQDFAMFPYGDRTLVGERGVTLSGGQKARINLARAVYRKADIYLLDDPLSAVDAHVSKHLFDGCISGLLRNKACVLVTHQLQFLKQADQILILRNGEIEAKGSYRDLQNTGLDFAKLLVKEEAAGDIGRTRGLTELFEDSVQGRSHEQSMRSMDMANYPLPESEMRTLGHLSATVYNAYFSAGGSWLLRVVVLIGFILTPIITSGADYWVAYWTNNEEQQYVTNTTITGNETGAVSWLDTFTCTYIYTGLTIGTLLSTLGRSFLFFWFAIHASMCLHNNMFNSVLTASMRFFNANPSGRIVNRFSKDMGIVDEKLPVSIMECFHIILVLLGVVTMVAVVNYWLLVPTCLLAVFGCIMRQLFLSTAGSLKRLEAITRSPIFTHLNASIQGLSTIRAFGAQTLLSKEFDKHQDLNTTAFYMFLSTSRAFAYWLDVGCLAYIAVVTFSFLLYGEDMFGGSVGLAVTQAISLSGTFQWGLRQSAELVNQMTSVERMLEFTNVEQDLSEDEDETSISSETKRAIETFNWPSEGKIEFKDVSLSYDKMNPPVLKNLCFTVQPKEKVGIVGRTGAGKSSIITALFRLAHTTGSVIIDGIDTKHIGLQEFRRKLSIIPQEPVIFSGTMRSNLDPFDEHSDEELWQALEEVDLKDTVIESENGLSWQMTEGGSNFSAGQKQLVCLARAIIRKNKILILDEATANVDPRTDEFIQHTIREKFVDCTVLTIAHRLHTVMDSDKVLVMDSGSVVEFDHPYILLQNKKGIFFRMVQQTGKTMADQLYTVAEECYHRSLRII
ncbi:ATP-binding cassette subfamily C member 4-like [Schistocerca gregaria]|uniref:ATP-binding cassette subfamily C member 4-like n=1 Tax=Schistocerca gregaria TaxID=7010 RepID=UPI00211E5B5D|nr:ATP-binding cassette subfamily C member 4-like [Schistocerca gregaria]